MKTINLEQWESASVDQRQEWLQNNVQLDELSGRILGYAIAFKDAGAIISTESMLKVYRQTVQFFAA